MKTLPKVPLAFLGVITASLVIFLMVSSKKKTTHIEEPLIIHVVTDIPLVNQPPTVALPDFASFEDVKEKKSAFFKYLLPLVKYGNQLVQVDRERFKRVQSDPINL